MATFLAPLPGELEITTTACTRFSLRISQSSSLSCPSLACISFTFGCLTFPLLTPVPPSAIIVKSCNRESNVGFSDRSSSSIPVSVAASTLPAYVPLCSGSLYLLPSLPSIVTESQESWQSPNSTSAVRLGTHPTIFPFHLHQHNSSRCGPSSHGLHAAQAG